MFCVVFICCFVFFVVVDYVVVVFVCFRFFLFYLLFLFVPKTRARREENTLTLPVFFAWFRLATATVVDFPAGQVVVGSFFTRCLSLLLRSRQVPSRRKFSVSHFSQRLSRSEDR